MPTLLDFARIVARSIAPKLCSSSSILLPTFMNPGEVSTMLSGRYCPEASAAAITKGFTLDPGSKMSVAARLRYRPGFSCSRSLGLYEGWFTMARTSPVSTSMTILKPQIDGRREVAPRPRRTNAFDVPDIAPLHVLDDALRAVFTVQ